MSSGCCMGQHRLTHFPSGSVGKRTCWDLFYKQSSAAILQEIEGEVGLGEGARLLPQSRQGIKRRMWNQGSRPDVAVGWHGKVRVKQEFRKVKIIARKG